MPENEITCIFFEIDTGMSTSNQFRCEIERPFTNLNEISTKLAGETYINSIQIDFQVIQFRANLNAHLKVYFNLQIRRFNFNNCSSNLVHQSFNLMKQAFNRQKGLINFIKSARN